MDTVPHATPRPGHAFLYLFMLVVAVTFASLALLVGPHGRYGLTLQSIFALGSVGAAVGLIAAMWNRRALLTSTSMVVAGVSLATLLLMTVIPRPALEPALSYNGAWTTGPIPLGAGWADLSMAVALGLCGIALAFARSPKFTTQIAALTTVRTVLWGAAFWQLAYATLDGDFSHLFSGPASLGVQIGLAVAIVASGAWLLHGDHRWLATLTVADNSLTISRYILPIAISPVIFAYAICLGERTHAYGAHMALLVTVEFLSAFLALLGLVAARTFWRRREANQELWRALEASPVVVHSSDGTIEYWPHECEEMFGFTADEAIGRRTQDLLKTQYSRPLEEIVSDLRSEGRWVGVVTQTTRDGQPLQIASTIVIHRCGDDSQVKVVATMTDITDLEY